jgi:CDP-6-deoxy-D-xylo-4-hexulose-3-dehydrase
MDSTKERRQRKWRKAEESHSKALAPKPFLPRETQCVYPDMFLMLRILSTWWMPLDFWMTTGRYAEQFEGEFAQWVGVRHPACATQGHRPKRWRLR